ncbi:MAG: quinoprotein dehydrogenase-associated SoxYZ-like carrier [Geminicoccaceae bacterium]|nr:quinoprotein dehydrogenase-associated SoxYZ-like carrier [Geminicoccaceae bacterium]MCS7268165.1 quinoprotein dehydrogenase-associated SoxYZ-like carrier [Geminicoccaceae bacterium]MCX7629597.1 quinoprotein dehydrogenase-associated SoxYZ-like carrier [Geminicoccaceae bacterium]MDW8342111.1 quinoprotein dehydrogenase-associated SoxYZ-like carrier [Geminicoccaceae bacterium]MDW8444052.1 quinoprotein dehydrogenase-associated SoxYZ-like carrier [Acetobacteraceae bacterium]
MSTHPLSRRRVLVSVAAASISALSVPVRAQSQWDVLRELFFENRPVADGTGVIELEAPARAHDAALVEVAVRALLPQTPERYVRAVHLLIDRNPAPRAAVFRFSPRTGSASIATRIRVNEYTPVRAVAELDDGTLFTVERFVKASGGCSAPASKDKEVAYARIGKMKLVQPEKLTFGAPNELRLLISHPQYSGMQIDQLTRNWIPADHLETIRITWNDEPVLEIEADISLSEDPMIAFHLVPEGPGTLRVEASDIKGRRFVQTWQLGAGA